MAGKVLLRLSLGVFAAAAVMGPLADCRAVRGAPPPAVTLLPSETAVVISLSDATDVAERFKNTAFGRMIQDPQIRPLVDQLYKSAAARIEAAQEQIGLSLSELAAIPQGEVTAAVVLPQEEPPAVVLLLDAGNHLADARQLMEKAVAALDRSGARRSEASVPGTKLTVFEGVGPRNRLLALFEKDGVIGASSSLVVLKQILAVWDGGQGATLAGDATFNALMSHCRGAEGESPQAIWYANPIALLEGIARNNAGAMMAVSMLPTLGLNGVRAVGGSIALDVGEFDAVTQTHLLLDGSRTGALEVLAFGSGSMEPQSWVPADAAGYTTTHVKPEKIYETVEKLYDGFRGEGALAAAMKQRLGRLAEIDFEEEVLPTLDGRLTHVVWMERPVTVTSQAQLLALGLKDAKLLATVLDRVVAENRPFLQERSLGGRVYFQYAPPQLDEQPPRPGRPRPCFGLLEGNLVVADRPGLYEEAIRTAADPAKSLAKTAAFRSISEEIRRRSAKPAMVSFERPQEGLRVAYEGLVAERSQEVLRRRSQNNPFLRTLRTALETSPLPPFAVLERYFAPQGAVLTDDASGLHYTGFTLRAKR